MSSGTVTGLYRLVSAPGNRQVLECATLYHRMMHGELKAMIEVSGHPVFDPKFLDDPETLLKNAEQYVYHYTRWERLLDIAKSGFRLGSLNSMNDPRESKEWIISTSAPNGVPAPDRMTLNKAVANYKDRVKIGSFSKDHPWGNGENFGRRGYGHPRMWAQYAGNHTGACIVFDRQKLDQAIRTRYVVKNDSWIHRDEVKYIDSSRQEPTNFVIKFNEGLDVHTAVRNYFSRSGHLIFFAKHVDWADEREYRWVYYDSVSSDAEPISDDKQFADIKGAVAGLVLGADFADAHLPVAQIFGDAHRLNGEVVKCLWDRLNLRLITFADDAGKWVPVNPPRGSMHLSWAVHPKSDQ